MLVSYGRAGSPRSWIRVWSCRFAQGYSGTPAQIDGLLHTFVVFIGLALIFDGGMGLISENK
mgnify:CR=1 FL=1